MELKLWSPLFDLDKEWRFDFPRFVHETTGFAFHPDVDVVKTDGALQVTAELPGIDPENVQVSLEGHILTIKGEKTEEKEVTEENRYLHERTYGKFSRRIPLPEGVGADAIAATYDKGILTVRVTLPEAESIEPRTIPVEVS